MRIDPSQVIVTAGESFGTTAHTSYVHHRDFPEVTGEGSSPEEAAAHLTDRLSLTLDHASSFWRRDCIMQALEDVQAFVERIRDQPKDQPVTATATGLKVDPEPGP